MKKLLKNKNKKILTGCYVQPKPKCLDIDVRPLFQALHTVYIASTCNFIGGSKFAVALAALNHIYPMIIFSHAKD